MPRWRPGRAGLGGCVEGGDDFVHVLRLRAEADDVDTHGEQLRHFVQQVVALRRHGLDAVDAQEILALARFQRQAGRVIQTLELAVVLVQVVVAGGETAGREGERQFAEDEELGLDASRLAAMQGFDQRAGRFQRRYPAFQAEAGEGGEGRFVVDIQVRAGDEILAADQIHRAKIVGFELAAGFIDQSAQSLQVAFRFEQGLG